ncbi:hypothetical protein MRX96_052133 [Rhipicephalus microplus]
MAIRQQPRYMEIEGLRLTCEFSPEPVRQALQFVPRSGDVVLVTYPKCGTHWVQQILQLIVNRGRSAENFFEWLVRTPLLELLGTRILDGASEPRLMKTHLPLNRMTLRDEASGRCSDQLPVRLALTPLFHQSRRLLAPAGRRAPKLRSKAGSSRSVTEARTSPGATTPW